MREMMPEPVLGTVGPVVGLVGRQDEPDEMSPARTWMGPWTSC